MKSIIVEKPVIFNSRNFFGIKEFDCISIWLFTEKTLQGTFGTSIPISSLEYRENNKTKAEVSIEIKNDWTIFNIIDDYGKKHIMEIHNSLSKEIEYAKSKAIEYKLI